MNNIIICRRSRRHNGRARRQRRGRPTTRTIIIITYDVGIHEFLNKSLIIRQNSIFQVSSGTRHRRSINRTRKIQTRRFSNISFSVYKGIFRIFLNIFRTLFQIIKHIRSISDIQKSILSRLQLFFYNNNVLTSQFSGFLNIISIS